MSKTVAVILGDDHWFWAYDVSFAILAVEVLRVAKAGPQAGRSWLDDLIYQLTLSVLVQGTYGLQLPVGLTDAQREHLLVLFSQASRRLRARRSITAGEAAEHYVVEQTPVFLRGASSVDTAPIADLADAVIRLIRGDLPPPPPSYAHWLYGTDDSPRGIGRKNRIDDL